MITESTLYWITRLDNVELLINASLLIGGSIFLVLAVTLYDNTDDKFLKKIFYSICVWILIAVLGKIFIPNTKEMCAILIVPKICQNEHVKEICPKVVNLANEWLDELRPENKKERRNKNGK